MGHAPPSRRSGARLEVREGDASRVGVEGDLHREADVHGVVLAADEVGEHDPDACYACLDGKEVKSECRCGKCCRLLVEVDVRDAEREPRIREQGSALYGPPDAQGRRVLAGYLLNVKANGYACAFLDQETNLCAIYETRPLVCRLFSCDGEGREQLVELGWLPPRQKLLFGDE